MRRLPAMLPSFLMIAALVACASSAGTTSGGATAGGAAQASSPRVRTNPDLITKAEIDAGGYRDAYDVVQRLRPTWFTKAKSSGAQSMGGIQVAGGVSARSGSAGGGLLVYLGSTRMGGPEALRDIPATSIATLQYMDAATATAKLPGIGSTVISGAIVATSRTGQ